MAVPFHSSSVCHHSIKYIVVSLSSNFSYFLHLFGPFVCLLWVFLQTKRNCLLEVNRMPIGKSLPSLRPTCSNASSHRCHSIIHRTPHRHRIMTTMILPPNRPWKYHRPDSKCGWLTRKFCCEARASRVRSAPHSHIQYEWSNNTILLKSKKLCIRPDVDVLFTQRLWKYVPVYLSLKAKSHGMHCI